MLSKIFHSLVFWGLILSMAITSIPVCYWAANHSKETTTGLVTMWCFMSISSILLPITRKNQPIVCLIGSPILAITGVAVFFNAIQKADVSTIAFAPVSAAIIQFIGLGIIIVISLFIPSKY